MSPELRAAQAPAPALPCPVHRWPVFSQGLDEALALPLADRPAWLAARPPEQADLVDAWARVLNQAPAAADAAFLRGPWVPDANPNDSALQPGAVIGPYALLERIGQGGMGEVWRARRADGAYARELALKLPHAHLPPGPFRERFARERDILAALEHPGIARLYDAGWDEAVGRPYLAMEWVPGLPLDEFVRRHPLSLTARLHLLLKLADALAHAHSRLVLHRDIKPANVLVMANGEPRLLDFGIARLMADGVAAGHTLTQVGTRVLTLDYASPEQVRGEPLGTGSDVYSLGVLAYELLSGQRPYSLSRGTAAELEEAITQREVPRASSRAANASDRQALRGNLDAVLAKALAKPLADRYATVEAFAQDLRQHLAGQAVSARQDSALQRLLRWARPRRVLLGSAAAVAASLGLALGAGPAAVLVAGLSLGLGAALWQARRARQAQARAEREAGLATAVKSCLLAIFQAGEAQPGQPIGSLSLRQALDLACERIDQQLTGHAEAQIEVLLAMAEIYESLDLPEPNLALTERALVIARQTAELPLLRRARILRELLQAALYHGLHRSVPEWLAELERLTPHLGADAAAWRPVGLYLHGRWLQLQGQPPEVHLPWLTEAAEAFARHAPRDPLRSQNLGALRSAYLGLDQPVQACQCADEWVALNEAQAPEDPQDVAHAFSVRGNLLLELQRFQAARADLQQAQHHYEAQVGAAHFLSLQNLAALGWARVGCGEVEDGLAQSEWAVRSLAELRPGQWTHLRAIVKLAQAQMQARQWQAALDTLRNAAQWVQALPLSQQVRLVDLLVLQARVHRQLGEPAQAQAALQAWADLDAVHPIPSLTHRRAYEAERALG